jgi:hypothetical protein
MRNLKYEHKEDQKLKDCWNLIKLAHENHKKNKLLKKSKIKKPPKGGFSFII